MNFFIFQGNAFKFLLNEAVNTMYAGNDAECLDMCEPLHSKVWEELNTGYWKDVPICWRQAYSLVSVMKALCLCSLLSDTARNIDHMSIIKTCDMGLLMGAPILNNILARMSHEFQEAFGFLKYEKAEEDNSVEDDKPCFSEVSLGKKAKLEEVSKPEQEKHLAEKEKEPENLDVSVSLPPHVETQTTRDIPRCSCPSVEMFQAMFLESGHPVVITDAIGYWPALTTRKWTIDYLRSVAGCRTVPVEIGSRYTEDDWTQKLITINELIDTYIANPKSDTKAYLAQHQLFDQVILVAC